MISMKYTAACMILMLMICGQGKAAEKTERSIKLPDDNAMATLKLGQGVEATRANCAICHSTDYIVRQPGNDAKHWDAEVKKMGAVFGAPISDGDLKAIVDYLASAYGPQEDSKTIPTKGHSGKLGKSQVPRRK